MATRNFRLRAVPTKSRNARRQRHGRNHLKVPHGLRALVIERASSRCEKCKTSAIETYHHVLPSSEGGINSLENVLGLCTACHVEIHRLPAFAGQQGWLKGKTTVPAPEPEIPPRGRARKPATDRKCPACGGTGEVVMGAQASEHGVRMLTRLCIACLGRQEEQ